MDIVTILDEIRAIARTGLHYSDDPFDRDRYERLLALASREYGALTRADPEALHARFLAETGHVTAKVGADAAVFDERGRILLVERADDGTWGMPAGWVEPGEHPAHTVVREIAEELGVDAQVDELVEVFARPASATDPHGMVAIVYLCTLHASDFRLQAHEVTRVAWWELDDVTRWHKSHERYARAARDRWRELRRS